MGDGSTLQLAAISGSVGADLAASLAVAINVRAERMYSAV